MGREKRRMPMEIIIEVISNKEWRMASGFINLKILQDMKEAL